MIEEIVVVLAFVGVVVVVVVVSMVCDLVEVEKDLGCFQVKNNKH